MVSVNTISGAVTAVASLRSIEHHFVSASKTIESGFRVSDAFDDASIFAVAQGVRANIKASAAVQASLAQASGTLDVTLAGLNVISDVLDDLRSTLIKVATGTNKPEALDTLIGDAKQMYRQIALAEQGAAYNGHALLGATGADVSFVLDTDGSSLLVAAAGNSQEYTDLGTAIDNITDTATAQVALDATETFRQTVTDLTGSYAAQRRQVGLQRDFIDQLLQAAQKSLGVLVDGDVAAAQAIRASVVVQRKLSIEAVDLANTSVRRFVNLIR